MARLSVLLTDRAKRPFVNAAGNYGVAKPRHESLGIKPGTGSAKRQPIPDSINGGTAGCP